jgi:hypothetical protein
MRLCISLGHAARQEIVHTVGSPELGGHCLPWICGVLAITLPLGIHATHWIVAWRFDCMCKPSANVARLG